MYIYDRLTENAQDHSTTESVMLEFFEYNNYGKKDDVVLIQVTNPLLRGINLEWLYEITYLNGGYDSALTVAPSRHFMWSSLGQPLNYNPVNRPMRQDIDPFYIENGAAYITEVGTLMTTKSRLSGRIGISKMPFYTSHELDEPEDWKILEAIQLDTQGARVAKLREYTRTFYKDTV